MKLFCANAFTGEDVDTVTKRMKLVVDALRLAGHDAYCPIFDPHKIDLQSRGDTKAIFAYAFTNLSKMDGMVAIVTSDRKSEGMLMEAGATLSAGKPLYLFIAKGVSAETSHLPKLATKTFTWDNEQELLSQLSSI